MIEVFRTDVANAKHANKLVRVIHQHFTNLRANFDLEDCDRILRVKSIGSSLKPEALIRLLKTFGVHTEILSDELSPRH
ncbi:MAG: hypothetical protein ABIO82_01410 [Ginsengibacter sp.]